MTYGTACSIFISSKNFLHRRILSKTLFQRFLISLRSAFVVLSGKLKQSLNQLLHNLYYEQLYYALSFDALRGYLEQRLDRVKGIK